MDKPYYPGGSAPAVWLTLTWAGRTLYRLLDTEGGTLYETCDATVPDRHLPGVPRAEEIKTTRSTFTEYDFAGVSVGTAYIDRWIHEDGKVSGVAA